MITELPKLTLWEEIVKFIFKHSDYYVTMIIAGIMSCIGWYLVYRFTRGIKHAI